MSYHTACLLFLICFWGLLLYSYAHPTPQHKPIDYSAYKPHYRHQRSFPRFYNPEMRDAMYQPQMGPMMERPMYRRNAGYSEPPMYPPQRGGGGGYGMDEEPYPYHPRQPMIEPPRDLFRVVPRGADEEYDSNPLTTKVVSGFDEEDEDMMREEELGDQLEMLDHQAPTRFISEGIAKKPKQVSYQMEMAQPQGRRTPYRPPPQMLLPEEDFQYQDDQMYPVNPHHAQHKRYQPAYQYYHQQPDYYQPEYEPRYPETMYQTPPHPRRMMPPPTQKAQPKRKPIAKIPEPVIYDDEFDDVESELPIISEEDDIVMKMPVEVAEIQIEEVRTVDDDDSDVADNDSAASVDDYFEHDDGFYGNPKGEYFEEPEAFETQEEDTTVMPKMTMPKTTMPKITLTKMPMTKMMSQQSESETAEVSESQDEIMQDTRSTQESSGSSQE